MNNATLWSLRLGFSARQAQAIAEQGLDKFLKQSFAVNSNVAVPAFLDGSPKSLAELKEVRKNLKAENQDEIKKMVKREIGVSFEMKVWWLEKMVLEPFPLLEKMTCFWHNHFVSTYQKVKVNHWIFRHNQLLRENAFGNFKTLTKKILATNAMVRYLDNTDNRKDKINENLSRELLELFTVGIGNYTESDIKNGARALAGLGIGEDGAVYRPFFEDNATITYLGKTGNFKADDLVDIIFEQAEIPYLITRKILQWFIYDNPDEVLVRYYGDFFRQQNFEMKPLLAKIFIEESQKENAGSKIKEPLVFMIQLMDELNIRKPNLKLVALFLKQQGMDLFNQPNVKGWSGGKEWLSTQIYLQRNNAADLLCNGKNLRGKISDDATNDFKDAYKSLVDVRLQWDKNGNNKQIIAGLKDRLLFGVDAATQSDFEKLLKYDFDPNEGSADSAVLRLFNYMVKTPEYQLI